MPASQAQKQLDTRYCMDPLAVLTADSCPEPRAEPCRPLTPVHAQEALGALSCGQSLSALRPEPLTHPLHVRRRRAEQELPDSPPSLFHLLWGDVTEESY